MKGLVAGGGRCGLRWATHPGRAQSTGTGLTVGIPVVSDSPVYTNTTLCTYSLTAWQDLHYPSHLELRFLFNGSVRLGQELKVWIEFHILSVT